MNAFVLAAGLGTRLRPITDDMPKILIEIAGEPLLARTIRYLRSAGVDRVVINTHHHADQIERFVTERELGVEIALSPERDGPLGTGGGLLRARPLLEDGGPFFIVIGDIVTDIDLRAVRAHHDRVGPVATLAVHERPTSRYMLFDERGLYGHVDTTTDTERVVRPPDGDDRRRAFAGIHVVSPRIFDLIVERGAFSIIPLYLRLAGEGHRIEPYDVTGYLWLEIGTPERLASAREILTGRTDLAP